MGVVGSPASTFNLYSYVRGNPINLTDPSGKFPFLLLVASAAFLGRLVSGIADILLNGCYNIVRTCLAALAGVLAGGMAVASGLVGAAWTGLIAAGSAAWGLISSAGSAVVDAIATAGGAILGLADKAIEWGTRAVNSIFGFVSQTINIIKGES